MGPDLRLVAGAGGDPLAGRATHPELARLDVLAFVFPFRAALQALSNAFSGTSPGIGWPLVHLAVLALAFGVLGRLALKRFATA